MMRLLMQLGLVGALGTWAATNLDPAVLQSVRQAMTLVASLARENGLPQIGTTVDAAGSTFAADGAGNARSDGNSAVEPEAPKRAFYGTGTANCPGEKIIDGSGRVHCSVPERR